MYEIHYCSQMVIYPDRFNAVNTKLSIFFCSLGRSNLLKEQQLTVRNAFQFTAITVVLISAINATQ